MRAIGVGDLHLPDVDNKGSLAAYVDNVHLYIISEFRRTLDYARDKGIKYVILYGDICNGPRMLYEAQIAFSETLQEYEDLIFIILLGNHDLFGNDISLGDSLQIIRHYNKTHKNVKFIVEPTVVTFKGGAKVKFLPFPHQDFDKSMLNVCHVSVYGATSDSGKEITDETQSKSKAVVLAGHIHTNHRVRNTYFSGTLYQTNFGEKLPKYFHLIEYNSPTDYEITNIPFDPKYKLHTIVANSKEDIPKNLTKFDLVKLVVREGADISPLDYKHLNVCRVSSYKTKIQLKAELTKDVPTNSVSISTEEFFTAWIEAQDIPEKQRNHISKLRKKVLGEL